MMLGLYSRVRIVTDRFADDGAPRGFIGYIIEVYPDNKFEVEVSNDQGTSIAQFVANADELESAGEGRDDKS